MDERIQKNSENHERDHKACRTINKNASSRRPGRKPQKKEPGINDADLIRIVGVLWPDFNHYLDCVKDFRRKDRIIYEMRLLLFLAIIERIMGHSSNRQHDQVKYEDPLKETVCELMDTYPEFLPHSDTMKYSLENLKPEEINGVRQKMVNKLLRGKKIYGMRTGTWFNRNTKFYRIAIDAVHYHTSNAPLEHSTHRTHSDGRTEYMLIALEASIVTPEGIRIPIMTEFIENPEEEYDKQDCELKAAKRLMKRLKDKFGRVKMIILLDGLYLCQDILKTVRLNGWELSVTVTEKTAAFLREAEKRLEGKSGRHFEGVDPKDQRKRKVSWCNGIKYKFGEEEFVLSVIKMTKDKDGKEQNFVYATTIFLHRNEVKTLRVLDEICRARWQIEEAFKVQKRHGFELEKAFGIRGYAGQNYYLVVQIADIIRTFMLHSSLFRRLQQYTNSENIKEVIQCPTLHWYGTLKHFVERFRRAILMRELTEIDMKNWRLTYATA